MTAAIENNTEIVPQDQLKKLPFSEIQKLLMTVCNDLETSKGRQTEEQIQRRNTQLNELSTTLDQWTCGL